LKPAAANVYVPILFKVTACAGASVFIAALRRALPALQLLFCAVRAHT